VSSTVKAERPAPSHWSSFRGAVTLALLVAILLLVILYSSTRGFASSAATEQHYRGVVAGSAILPWFISIVWLAFLKRFDRAHPEPLALILSTFVVGAIAVLPSAALEAWLQHGPLAALPSTSLLWLATGLIEELFKFLAVYLFVRRSKEFDEPIDGIVYAGAASLGFAALENMKFFALAQMSAPVVLGRALLTVPAHMFFGTLWGFALGRRIVFPKTRLAPYVLAAAFAHGVFDIFVTRRNARLLALGEMMALTSVFLILVRKSLQRGSVHSAHLAIESTQRALFPIGNRALFRTAVVCLYALGALSFLYTFVFFSGTNTSIGAALGAGALGVALGTCVFSIPATMPLDVAVDRSGITLAGSTIGWNEIEQVRSTPIAVLLVTRDGLVTLGPTTAGGQKKILEATLFGIDTYTLPPPTV
jgi:protease PrsW